MLVPVVVPPAELDVVVVCDWTVPANINATPTIVDANLFFIVLAPRIEFLFYFIQIFT